ncbi:hypothetical protein [Butyrivibrio sp. NC3005]|uniref:hypothetical protein n=1 Tax=Butyrivibrio sp. NC3005 TaxID=1280685 RepID=UPI0004285413|nr:hypothetical protein [Butyrivibrio sp. NC3005]
MKFPFLAMIIVLCFWIHLRMKMIREKGAEQNENFWEREQRANSTRKQNIDYLPYIKIPEDSLPFGALNEEPEVISCEKTIRRLASKDKKILNLTGITNTELKFKYGAANLMPLTEYDENYMILVTTLKKWAKLLYEDKLYKEAANVCEFAVSTRTDTSEVYFILCDIYKNHLDLTPEEAEEKIKSLLPIANSINALSKTSIVNYIEDQIG